jgi:hypothetical protein
LNEVHEERRTFFRRLFDEFDDELSEYRVKKCQECGMDPLGIWWEDYLQRATTSVSARPLGDRVFDLNVLCPPDDDVEEFGCQKKGADEAPNILITSFKLRWFLSRASAGNPGVLVPRELHILLAAAPLTSDCP